MQNYEAITIREASLAHAKDINTVVSDRNGNKYSRSQTKDVLLDAQGIYEFLTQDSGEDEPEGPVQESPVDPLALGGYYQDGWNGAIDAVLNLQYGNNLSLDDSVNVRAARTAGAALRKVDA